ncbi:MAG: hypothetical protein ACREF3_00525 [Acetobacteraceae bacterium]
MDEGKPPDEEDDGGPRIGALIGLVVIALLVLGGLWLTRQLHSSASMQDCLASGRTNCAPVEAPGRP